MRLRIASIAAFSCLLAFPAAASAIFSGSPSSAPYVVNVEIGNSTCTGSLVSQTRILTAAHCLRRGGGYVKRVRVGMGSDYNTLSWQTVTDIRPLKSFRMYSGGWRDDLAVLVLPAPAEVEPVSLGQALQSRSSRTGEIHGWGTTEKWGYPSRLLSVGAPVLSLPACRREVRREKGSVRWASAWYCVGDLGGGDPFKARTACIGDSGGPLLIDGKLVGVLSFYISDPAERDGARDCASSYMYYLRLDKRLQAWISSQL